MQIAGVKINTVKKLLSVLYVATGAVALLVPLAAYAQGLVPCTGIECNLCDVGHLMQNVIDYTIVGLAIPLAAAMFAYAGALYFTASGNLHRVAKAHKIFKNVLTGFLIAISAWLIINTIMTVVFSKSFFNGGQWFEIQCIEKITNKPDGSGRLIGTSFADLLNEIIPVAKAPAYNVTYSCPAGYTYRPESGDCFNFNGATQDIKDPIVSAAPVTGDVSTGSCAPNPIFGSQANLMSCICGAESSGVASQPSRTDIMRNDPARRAFSYGLYQINLTVNDIRCPGQPVLNCPDAFAGTNYDARVTNEALFATCVAAARRPDCNANSALYLLTQTPNGARNWSTYGQCVR